MDPIPEKPEPLAILESWLAGQMKARTGDFDMNDEPDAEVIEPFAMLATAIAYLQRHVTEPWRTADQLAIESQARHHVFSSVAIAAGVWAVVSAVLQLALKVGEAADWQVNLASGMEVIAAIAACIAVIVGLWAKFDHHWLEQRHKAERLRMLKFQSLRRTELWNGDCKMWEDWVRQQVEMLLKIDTLEQIEAWVSYDDLHSDSGPPLANQGPADSIHALGIYYRHKRLLYQADYFDRKGRAARDHWAVRRHRLQLYLFMGSVVCVIAHFGCDLLIAHTRSQAAGLILERLGLILLVTAALLPVLSIGLRTYLSVFELARKARSFKGKHKEMIDACDRILAHPESLDGMLKEMKHDEQELEHEHRDWLRLLMHVEWFL